MHSNIKKYIKAIEPVGSRITCVPAPTDTDQDYLVLCKSEDTFEETVNTLKWDMFEICGDGDYVVPANEDEEIRGQPSYSFQSLRKGDVNYIITESSAFFEDFMRATVIAKQHNLLRKLERVALFQWVLYDVLVDGLEDYLNEKWPDECNQPPTVEQMIEAIRSLSNEPS